MQCIGENRRGVSICEIEKLEGNAFLVRGDAEGGKKHVNEASIAGPFGQAIVLEGCERNAGVHDGG